MAKFTETFLKNLDYRKAGKTFSDAGYTGKGSLIARVAKSGRVSFYVKFQNPASESGQSKVLLNERHPLLKHHGIRAFLQEHEVEDLRDLAKIVVKETLGAGDDYSGPMTVAQLKDAYIDRRRQPAYAFGGRHAKNNLRSVELMFERAIKIWGGDTRVRDLNKTHAEELIAYISENHGPSAANRTKASLVKPLKFAQRTDKAVDTTLFQDLEIDPALYQVKPRETVLNRGERLRFFQALKDFGERDFAPRPNRKGGYRREGVHTEAAEYFRLIYLCAARKGEAEFMTWGEVDLEKGTWLMPAAKRKNQEHLMYLPVEAIEVLKRQRARYPNAADEDRVFPMINHADAWADFQTIKELAEIDSDLTIHDLRASRVTQWATEGDSPKSEAVLAAMIGSKDVKGLIRVYVRDSATDDEKRFRVNAEGDADLAI
ncbi:MAG: tyrosine-type recombinase/integrase [Pseudomonadota bacterium]